jgi:hypothetical protein
MAGPENQAGGSGSTSVSGGVQGATSAVSGIAQQATERVREQASRAAGQAQHQAQAFLSQQKDVAAGHLEGVAKVLHDTVDQLRERSPGAVTEYAERAVDSLDSVAAALRDQDVRSLVGQVEDFARRQPVLFLAGSVAIGFALARFLKSSSRNGGYTSYGQGGQYGAATGSQPRTEYGRHMDTQSGSGRGAASGSDRQGYGSRSSSGLGGSAPAMGSSDGPASPQYSTTRGGTSSGTGQRSPGEPG